MENIIHQLIYQSSKAKQIIMASAVGTHFLRTHVYEAVLALRIFARPGGTIRHVPSDSPLTVFKILEANAVKQSPCKIDVAQSLKV